MGDEMGADDAALLGLDGFGQAYEVKVSEPVESDTGEFGEPDAIDDVRFWHIDEAKTFCEMTARRGLRAVLYKGCQCIQEFE
jgi:hypothetical protein